jgi:hypothetical protein
VFQLNAAWIFTVQSFSANNLDVSFARTAGQQPMISLEMTTAHSTAEPQVEWTVLSAVRLILTAALYSIIPLISRVFWRAIKFY